MINNKKNTPWGLWWTIILFLSINLLILLIQLFIVHIFFATDSSPIKITGHLLSISILVTYIPGICCLIFLSYIKKNITIKNYLSFNNTSIKNLILWVTITLFLLVIKGISSIFIIDSSSSKDFVSKMLTTSHSIILIYISVGIIAPIFEELMYRGFLFKGLQYSKLGPIGAILITSLIWSVVHVQYDIINIIFIFLIGITLGIARLKTHSIYVPIAMHIFINLASSIAASLI